MDRGAWRSALYGVTKSQTRLSDWTHPGSLAWSWHHLSAVGAPLGQRRIGTRGQELAALCVFTCHVPKLHKAGHRAASFRSCGSLPVGAGLRAVAGPQQLSPVLRTACLLFSLRPRRWDGVGQARGGGHSPNPHAKLCAQTWQGIVKTHPKQCG